MDVEIRIDVRRCLHILWKNMLPIVFVAILTFVLVVFLTPDAMEDTYQARVAVYSTAESGYSYAQAVETTSAMQRYLEVVQSQKVLGRAASLLEDPAVTAEALSEMISVRYDEDSYILYLYATTSSPGVAVGAVNAVAASFVSEITAITGKSNVQILDPATGYSLIRSGARTRWLIRLAVTLLAAAAVGGGYVVRDILSGRLHSLRDFKKDTGLEILGTIPNLPTKTRAGRNAPS